MHAYPWASEASALAFKVEVGAVVATLATWRPKSDQSLGLPKSTSETSAILSLGVVVATAAEVPHPAVPAALAGHASLLCAFCLTSAEGNHISELILQIFQHKKRVYSSSTTLNKQASSLTPNTGKHNFVVKEEIRDKKAFQLDN